MTGNDRRCWWLAAAGFALALVAVGGIGLGVGWSPALTARWAVGAALVLGSELWFFWRQLPRHRRSDGLRPRLGPGNALTLARGAAVGLLAGFLLTPWPPPPLAWLPAVLYTLAGLADYFDGYLARASGTATAMGETLDIEFDALGVLAASTLAIHFGQWPAPFLIIGLARYLFVAGLWLRRRRRLPIVALSPSGMRRTLAGLQMGFLSVALWPIMPPALATLSGLCFALPFLVIFGRDWLLVSGALADGSPRYRRLAWAAQVVLVAWGPLLARALAAIGAAIMLAQVWRDFAVQVTHYAAFGLPNPQLAAIVFGLMLAVAIPALLIGAATRFFALWLVVPVGFGIAARGGQPADLITLVAAIYLLVFGPGRWAIWQPEERLVQRRAGEA